MFEIFYVIFLYLNINIKNIVSEKLYSSNALRPRMTSLPCTQLTVFLDNNEYNNLILMHWKTTNFFSLRITFSEALSNHTNVVLSLYSFIIMYIFCTINLARVLKAKSTYSLFSLMMHFLI